MNPIVAGLIAGLGLSTKKLQSQGETHAHKKLQSQGETHAHKKFQF